MNKAVKTTLAVAASIATIAGVVATPSMVSAWGNSGNTLRPVYTKDEINNGALGDKIVFNSITDSVIGDERNFVAARLNDGDHGQDNVWSANDIDVNATDTTVNNGNEYIIRLYYHNNSPKGTDAVAKNTRVGISIPQISATEVQVNGHIYTDSGEYNDYYDYVNFKADVPFHLEYVAGSARLYNNGIGKADDGVQLSDNVVYQAPTGVQVGYSSLNGEVPGCYSFSGYVAVKVKVVYDTAFTLTQQVRLVGSSEWSDSVDAKVGDKVEFWIQYRNTSSENQMNVMIRDVLPTSLRYVSNTTQLWSADYNGLYHKEDTITTDGFNIGHYAPNANAHIRFQAEVVEDGLACGGNVLGNWSQASTNGTIMQTATVVNVQNGVCENKDEEKPNTLPNTGPEAVAGGVIAAGSIATAAGYYIVSRRSLR